MIRLPLYAAFRRKPATARAGGGQFFKRGLQRTWQGQRLEVAEGRRPPVVVQAWVSES